MPVERGNAADTEKLVAADRYLMLPHSWGTGGNIMTIMRLLNATQHPLTPEQVRDARLYCHEENIEILNLSEVDSYLFEILQDIPKDADLKKLAFKLLRVVNQFDYVHLPISSPAFMWVFAQVCAEYYDSGDGVWHQPLQAKVLFSHSKRQSVEETMEDGVTIKKRQIFKFEKFVEVQ